jgi:gluconokinase
MNLLCFDMSSGGISAALLNAQLDAVRVKELAWGGLAPDERGAATLALEGIMDRFKACIGGLNLTRGEPVDVICIGTFLHNFVMLDQADQPLTPLFTWLDRRGDSGLEYVRSRVGRRFHEITGCRYHPMFPVFKVAAMHLSDAGCVARAKRVASAKAVLINRLTGVWVEDHGIASASGLFNIRRSQWDAELLNIVGLNPTQLPSVAGRSDVVGRVSAEAASRFGLKAGTPVIAGSGDGFLANMGSDCEGSARIAVSLGTSAVARQTVRLPVLDVDGGTFCYRADEDTYLLGCAGSNGGNVLDWGRRIFGDGDESESESGGEPPIFIPLLHGERSPEWNPHLTGSWHGLTARHSAADLARSILEGVVFNLAHFIEIVQQASGEKATDLVLSGNGFLHPLAAPILAAVTGMSASMPAEPGQASLRGAGICALRALAQPVPALDVDRVSPLEDPKVLERYTRYRELRADL